MTSESYRGRALIVAGSPEPSSPALVAGLAASCDVVVAADRGLDACRAAGIVPAIVIGDEDSASAEAIAWARSHGVEERVFTAEKDDSDLGLALAWAQDHAGETVVTCAAGGRPDHALAVFGCLARYAHLSPALVEDGLECRVLSPEGTPVWQLGEDALGATFSAIALAGDAVVSERGMRWELDHAQLACLSDLGISNRVTDERARIEVHAGIVAAFLVG